MKQIDNSTKEKIKCNNEILLLVGRQSGINNFYNNNVSTLVYYYIGIVMMCVERRGISNAYKSLTTV